MCGRYYIADEDESSDLQQIIDYVKSRSKSDILKTRGEIFPNDTVPVIANNRKLEPDAFSMKWGYTASNGGLIINARSETAAEKLMFRDGMAQRRCIIPASNYFEWQDRKIKYAIRPESVGTMFMAGLYRFEADKPVFTILTRNPVESIAFIHNRMPVILPRGMIRDWLNPGKDAEMMLEKAEDRMRFEAIAT